MFNFLLSVKSDKHSPKRSLCTDFYCNEMKTAFLLRRKALTQPPHGQLRMGMFPWVPMWLSAGTRGSHSSVRGLMKTSHSIFF